MIFIGLNQLFWYSIGYGCRSWCIDPRGSVDSFLEIRLDPSRLAVYIRPDRPPVQVPQVIPSNAGRGHRTAVPALFKLPTRRQWNSASIQRSTDAHPKVDPIPRGGSHGRCRSTRQQRHHHNRWIVYYAYLGRVLRIVYQLNHLNKSMRNTCWVRALNFRMNIMYRF